MKQAKRVAPNSTTQLPHSSTDPNTSEPAKQQAGIKIVNHHHFQAMITLWLSSHNDLYSSQNPTPHVPSL